jgi:hypothetical protein
MADRDIDDAAAAADGGQSNPEPHRPAADGTVVTLRPSSTAARTRRQ